MSIHGASSHSDDDSSFSAKLDRVRLKVHKPNYSVQMHARDAGVALYTTRFVFSFLGIGLLESTHFFELDCASNSGNLRRIDCPQKVYDLMLRTWSSNLEARPMQVSSCCACLTVSVHKPYEAVCPRVL